MKIQGETPGSDVKSSDQPTYRVVYEGLGPTTAALAPEDRRDGYLVQSGTSPAEQSAILKRASEQIIAAASEGRVDLSASW